MKTKMMRACCVPVLVGYHSRSIPTFLCMIAVGFTLSLLFLSVAPAFAAKALSVQSGPWSDPNTWDIGVPTPVDDVTIQSGHTVMLDVGTVAVMSFTLEEGSVLESASGLDGAPGEPGEDAGAIAVTAVNNIILHGLLRSGNGGNGGAQSVTAPALGGATANGGNGGKGGDITLVSQSGDIRLPKHIESGPVIILGNGGVGGAATARGSDGLPGSDGGDAEARGGVGGTGGSLVLTCAHGDLTIFPGESITPIVGGNGGRGGDSTARAGTGDVDGGIVVGGGHGGPSGDITIECGTLNGSHTIADLGQFLLRILGGGRGGEPGKDTIEPSSPGNQQRIGITPQQAENECWNPAGRDGKPIEKKGTDGAAGYLNPTSGDPAFATAMPGIGTGKGGSATATGGTGGTATAITVSIGTPGITAPITLASRSGDGGHAMAVGGAGGPIGGEGGNATARGGDAGAYQGIRPASLCSLGGDAEATGGNGGNGTSCCDPPAPGQSAGTGGSASAQGGNSTNFVLPSFPRCRGGIALAIAGSGGNGGSGRPPGVEGGAGTASAMGGTGDPNGREDERAANGGTPGDQCKPH